MVKTAPAAVVAVGGFDRPVHRLHEAAGDGEPEAGAGTDPVALGGAVELVEDAREIGGRNAFAFVDDPQRDEAAVAPAMNAIWWSPPGRTSLRCPIC